MEKIVIQSDLDLTPRGKRSIRIVNTRGRFGAGRVLRWYVSGAVYVTMAVNPENVGVSLLWVKSKSDNPQTMRDYVALRQSGKIA